MSLDPGVSALIGFAAKSGKLLLGAHSVEEGIRRRRAKLVLVAADINPKRSEILEKWCRDMDIPYRAAGIKADYGALLRKPPLGLLALTDSHMAEGIIKAVKRSEESNGGD